MHKYIIITILALSIILTACNGDTITDAVTDTMTTVGTESMDLYKEVPIEYVNDVFDFSVNDNGAFFIADKDIIHIINKDGAKEGKIPKHIKFGTKITADNANIWVWDSNQKAIICLDKEGNLIEKKPVELNSINKIICTDKLLFILGRDMDGVQNIYQYTYGNSDIDKVPIENAIGMCLYTNECLLVVVQEAVMGTKIIRFNYHTQKVEAETETTALFFNDIFYSPNDEHIYLAEGGRLIRLSSDSNTREVLLDLSNKEAVLTKICVFNNNILLLDRKNSKILTIDKNLLDKIASSEKKIKILSRVNSFSGGTVINNIINNTKEKYPGSSFEFEYVERDEYYTKLKTMLMAKDKTFDVFYMESQHLPPFIKNDVMHDLTEYNFIKDRFADCFDKIRDLCMFDNKVFGIPKSISVKTLAFNTELAKKVGITKPTPGWDWNDFYSMASKIRDSKLSDNIYIMECIKDFFCVYFLETFFCESIDPIENKANIITEDFRNILNISKQLYDKNLVSTDKTPTKYSDSTLLYLCFLPMISPQITDIVTTPTFSKYDVHLEYLCVNRLSDKKEISAYFISNYLNEEVYNKDIHIEPFFKDIKTYKGLLSTEENYNLYNYILDNSGLRYYHKDLNILITTTILDYLNGKITVDETMKLIQQKADFILNE